jgi:hypothetical protein
MQISPRLFRRARSGYALVVVMISMALLIVVFASVLYWASTTATLTLRNNYYNGAEAAAESSTENILAYMMRDFSYGSINAVSSYNTLAVPTNGWPMYYVFSDTNGNTAYTASISIGMAPSTATPLNSQFAGLYGFAQPVEIASTASPQNIGTSLSATVYQSVQFALIPLFQFAIFYNMDLEINPGAAMTVNGHVHSNNNIWATGVSSGSPLTFSSDVDAAGTVSNLPSPLDPQNTSRSGNVVYSAVGSPVQDYTSMSLPIGGTTNNNPTNVTAILNLPPATYAPPNFTAAYSTNGMIYPANEADLIISNAANGLSGTSGTNLIVYYQNPNNPSSYLTQVPGDVLVVSNVVNVLGVGKVTNMIYAYSFVTNVSFYDFRQGQTAQAVQIDVSQLNTWLGASNTANTVGRGGSTYSSQNTSGSTSKGHAIYSIFVTDSVNPTSSQFPAVRMVNGQQLPPAGLTVATAVPLYVKGNYNITTNGTAFSTTLGNTTNTVPAALMGDAITILSSNWSDAYTNGTSLSSRTVSAGNTTINAAALEGIVPSNGTHYSGGVENFMRLLENWSGTLTYNGSIVVMFPSQYATNFWQTTGNYYNPPTRNWGFDLNFNTSTKLPPMTPTVKAVIRGSWLAW